MIKGIDYPGISVVFFCHDGKGNYLLAKRGRNCRDECGRWDTGGGGVEFGENIESVLKQEVKQEYGAEIIKHEFLGFRDIHRQQKRVKTHWVALDFKVLVDPLQVKNGEPHKFDEIGWFKLNSLPNPLHSQLPKAVANYKDLL